MPALKMERPKMSLSMWAALKSHIMKQREKKKQEQAADRAVKKLQKEQEKQRKQHVLTLEEMREQYAQKEKKLQSLRNEKHEMFIYLKRVLHDDKKRTEDEKEANEKLQMTHHYPNPNIPVAAPNLYTIANNRPLNRNPVMPYKVGTIIPPMQNGSMKRQRSPSPPPTSYPQSYGYKTHVSAYGQNYPMPHPSSQYSHEQHPKPLPSSYHVPHMQPSGFVPGMPPQQQMERPSPKPNNIPDEKYYIQAGSISSGYPMRTQPQPPSHYQPSTSHNATAPIQVPLRKEDVMRRHMTNDHHR